MGNIRKKISHIFTSFLTLISPKLNTKFLYWRRFGKKLDFDNPQTSNEKVLWLKFKITTKLIRYNHKTNRRQPQNLKRKWKYSISSFLNAKS